MVQLGCVLCFELGRGEHIQRGVASAGVVEVPDVVGDGLLQASVGVGDDQLHPAQVARLIVIALAYAAVGTVGGALVSAVITRLITPFPLVLLTVMVGTAASALVVTLATAILSGRRQRLDVMVDAVDESAAEVDRLRRAVQDRRTSAARFLHGPIQGELVAAALRGDNAEEVRATISGRFEAYGSEPTARPARDQVMEVIDAWSMVFDVSTSIDDAVWPLLERDAARTALVVDVLSEGFTNAVRHSTGSEVSVNMASLDGCVEIRLVSQGETRSSAHQGIGLAMLGNRSVQLTLAPEALV